MPNQSDLPRSVWLVIDNRHEPEQLVEHHCWYDCHDAWNDAAWRKRDAGIPAESKAIEVIEISVQ